MKVYVYKYWLKDSTGKIAVGTMRSQTDSTIEEAKKSLNKKFPDYSIAAEYISSQSIPEPKKSSPEVAKKSIAGLREQLGKVKKKGNT